MFAREELSLRVMEDERVKEWAVSTQPSQTVLIQSHKLTSGTSCTCFHQSQWIPFPSNALLLPKPSKFNTIEPSDVSAELFTPHRRCSHVAFLLLHHIL